LSSRRRSSAVFQIQSKEAVERSCPTQQMDRSKSGLHQRRLLAGTWRSRSAAVHGMPGRPAGLRHRAQGRIDPQSTQSRHSHLRFACRKAAARVTVQPVDANRRDRRKTITRANCNCELRKDRAAPRRKTVLLDRGPLAPSPAHHLCLDANRRRHAVGQVGQHVGNG